MGRVIGLTNQYPFFVQKKKKKEIVQAFLKPTLWQKENIAPC